MFSFYLENQPEDYIPSNSIGDGTYRAEIWGLWHLVPTGIILFLGYEAFGDPESQSENEIITIYSDWPGLLCALNRIIGIVEFDG